MVAAVAAGVLDGAVVFAIGTVLGAGCGGAAVGAFASVSTGTVRGADAGREAEGRAPIQTGVANAALGSASWSVVAAVRFGVGAAGPSTSAFTATGIDAVVMMLGAGAAADGAAGTIAPVGADGIDARVVGGAEAGAARPAALPAAAGGPGVWAVNTLPSASAKASPAAPLNAAPTIPTTPVPGAEPAAVCGDDREAATDIVGIGFLGRTLRSDQGQQPARHEPGYDLYN